jgi:hypothetical protein
MKLFYLQIFRSTSNVSQQRDVRHNQQYITATSENCEGTKEKNFASLAIWGSAYYHQQQLKNHIHTGNKRPYVILLKFR